MWFWGLTCDFWAEVDGNKCKSKKQQQIPHSTSLRAGSTNNKKGQGNSNDWNKQLQRQPTLSQKRERMGHPLLDGPPAFSTRF
jgi:hypothetical protein